VIGVDGEPTGLPLLVGGAITLSQSYFGVSTPNSHGKGAEVGFVAYAIGRFGDGYVSAIGFGGAGRMSDTRNLYALGLNLSTTASFNNITLGGRVEGGYSFAIGNTGFHATPFVALQPMRLRQSAAGEQFGTLGAGLNYAAADITALPGYLGMQFDGTWNLPNGARLQPFIRLAWMHDFMPSRDVARSFAELPGVRFSGSALPQPRDAAAIHVGSQFQLAKNLSARTAVDMLLSGPYKTYGASANLVYNW
jgi:outer membrane autotransporter protein